MNARRNVTFYTIGYEGVNANIFLACLKNNNIDILVDVRQKPYSRKPGFSQKKLIEETSIWGIAYKHISLLGCPDSIRKKYNETGNWAEYCSGYKSHLHDHDVALEEVAVYLRNFKCALMCFEANANRCHRSLIAAKLVQNHEEFELQNLLPINDLKKESSAVLKTCFV